MVTGCRPGCPMLCRDALLASVYRRGDCTVAGRGVRRGCVAAPVSPLLEYNYRQQLERVATPVSGSGAAACYRVFLLERGLSVGGRRKNRRCTSPISRSQPSRVGI